MVIVNEPECSILDFLKIIGVVLATQVPDQRAIVNI